MTDSVFDRLRNRGLNAFLALRATAEAEQGEASSSQLASVAYPTVDFDKFLTRHFVSYYTNTPAGDGNLTIALNNNPYILEISHIVIEKESGTFTMSDILWTADGAYSVELGSGTAPFVIFDQSFGSGNGMSNVGASDRSVDMVLGVAEQLFTTISGHSVDGPVNTILYGRALYRPNIPF